MRIIKGSSDNTASVGNIKEDTYSTCRQYITSAIESLSDVATTDEIAKNAIANLAVVLLDLHK